MMKNYFKAVKIYNIKNLKDFPEEFRTKELCWKCVKGTYGWGLEYVPEKFKTKELCWEAIKTYPWALEYTPKELITYELCLSIIQEVNSLNCIIQNLDILKYVPEKFKTYELCLESVTSDSSLEYVPEKFKTKEMFLEAVSYSTKIDKRNFKEDMPLHWVSWRYTREPKSEFVPEKIKQKNSLKTRIKKYGSY